MVLACSVWGSQWSGQTVQAYYDNKAAVVVLNTGYSRGPTDYASVMQTLFYQSPFSNGSQGIAYLRNREYTG